MNIFIFKPKDLDELERLSRIIAHSGRFADLNTWETVATIIMTGMELGLSPMLACRNLRITREGSVGMSADIMVAICVGNDKCERFEVVTSSDEEATWIAKRKGGSEQTYTFSLDDARKAELYSDELPVSRKTGKPYRTTWHKYTRNMLNARAKSALARLVFPDLMAGVYDPEELEGTEQPEVASPKAEQAEAAKREDQATIQRMKELVKEHGAEFCKDVCEGIDRGTPEGRRAAVKRIEAEASRRDEPGGGGSSDEKSPNAEPRPVQEDPSRGFSVPKPGEWKWGANHTQDAGILLLARTMKDVGASWDDVCADTRELFDFPSPFFLRPERLADLVRLLRERDADSGPPDNGESFVGPDIEDGKGGELA